MFGWPEKPKVRYASHGGGAIAVLVSRFEGFDLSLEEASRDLGETGWMTFWRVTFPLVLPGIVALQHARE